jgi:protein O-mannosyl-transferase
MVATLSDPWVIAFVLVVATFAAFAPVLSNEFVDYDDTVYVTKNPMVQEGLTWAGVRWAFTTGHAGNWHPITWLSHMLDCELYGLSPRGHHLTSLILHAANALLLFQLLRRTTGAALRSALVAALFALHPTRVESVAWIAERKDLLGAFFWLAAMLAYVRRAGAEDRSPTRSVAVIVLFALGLLSKPMVVTLPVTLLVLDHWPLARTRARSLAALAWEKAPLFALAGAAGIVTLVVQSRSGAVASVETLGMGERLANAVVSYATYLRQLVWPAPLAVFYPYAQAARSLAPVLGLTALLAALTFAAHRMRSRAPYVWSGWIWFLVTLAPVIGIIQAGEQAHADRYTYIPYIGLFVIFVWGLSASVASVSARVSRALGPPAGAAALAALAALGLATHAQARLWRTSETLFEHALRVTRDNDLAHNNLGHVMNERGRYAEAVPHFREALRIRSEYPHAHTNLVRALFMLSEFDSAAAELNRWLADHPADAAALSNLALVRAWQGDRAEAARLYNAAVASDSGNVGARRGLGALLMAAGDAAGAIPHLEKAIALDDTDAETRGHLGDALFLRGEYGAAIEHYREALRLRPDFTSIAAKLERARAEQARRAGLSEAR